MSDAIKPPLHGRDHLAGGQDPIPGLSSGFPAWAAQSYTGSNVTVAGGGHHGQFIVSVDPTTLATPKFFTSDASIIDCAKNADYSSYGAQLLIKAHWRICGQFRVTSFGAGTIDLTVNLAEGPGFVSWAGEMATGHILASTALYGDDTAEVFLNTEFLAQTTTAAGGLPVPMVWNVDNNGTNSATVEFFGYQVFQLDAIDTSLL